MRYTLKIMFPLCFGCNLCFFLMFMFVLLIEMVLREQIALEELAERTNGDIRMALNHLQYMGLSMSVIKFDDIKQRLQSNSKDEDISPFTAVDK